MNVENLVIYCLCREENLLSLLDNLACIRELVQPTMLIWLNFEVQDKISWKLRQTDQHYLHHYDGQYSSALCIEDMRLQKMALDRRKE